MDKFNELTASSDFGKWFWQEQEDQTGIKGADLIQYLNRYASGTKKVRYEVYGPYIYGIKLKSVKLEIGTEKMTLVKVGFTHSDTDSNNSDNRMNKVMDEVKRKMKEAYKVDVTCSVLFVLPIDALDTRCFFDVEEEVRKKTGVVVPKHIGKALRLPVHTEWVVTTNAFITAIRGKINKLKPTRTPKAQEKNSGRSTGKQPTPSSDSEASVSTKQLDDELSKQAKKLSMRSSTTIDTKAVFGLNGLDFEKSECSPVDLSALFPLQSQHFEVKPQRTTNQDGTPQTVLQLLMS